MRPECETLFEHIHIHVIYASKWCVYSVLYLRSPSRSNIAHESVNSSTRHYTLVSVLNFKGSYSLCSLCSFALQNIGVIHDIAHNNLLQNSIAVVLKQGIASSYQ